MTSARTGTSKVYLVERVSPASREVFEELQDALEFARSLPGSTLHELVIRDSLGPRRDVFERRVRVSGGVVVQDSWHEEYSYALGRVDHSPDDVHHSPGEVDLESYEASNGDWNVVGIGCDVDEVRRQVDAAVANRLGRRT